MITNRILILGGYGNTGHLIAKFLLKQTDVQIVLAGRNKEKAESCANILNQQFEGTRVTGISLDGSKYSDLVSALQGISLFIAASSTSQFVEVAARACLTAGVDYFDVQFSNKKVSRLKSLTKEILASGRCFVTDGGFHPGLPATLIRVAGLRLDELICANVGSVISIDWANLEIAESTVVEMAGEFNDFSMLFFRNGNWKKARMDIVVDSLKMDFGAPYGIKECMPMFLEELRNLPTLFPKLKDTGFFVGGFNPVTDYFVLPLIIIILKIAPKKG